MFTDSLTDTSPDGVGAFHKPLADGGEKNQSAQMKVVQGDYLASNRVLTPTLRLKPFSITGISADVAPASPDPLELPASCPFVFAGSLPLCWVILSGPRSAEGDWGPWESSRPDSQIATANAGRPRAARLHPCPLHSRFPFSLELKSIRASPCLKSHSEADEHLCPIGWSLSLCAWLASWRCEALTHSCPISGGLMLRLIPSRKRNSIWGPW